MKNALIAILFIGIAMTASAQDNDPFKQLLAFSAPGKPHEILNRLTGRWAFQDVNRTFVKGTLERKPIFEGRFYLVEITGGKLPIPVANGQMKETNYRGLQLEGYDNVKRSFVRRTLTIVDAHHYIEEYFEEKNGNPEKVRELRYTRIP